MSLKIVSRHGKKTKAQNLYIRGNYLGVAVDQSARTDRRSLAVKILKRIEGEIERGEYRTEIRGNRGEPTFVSAAIVYMEAGHQPRYVQALVDYFQDTPLSEIKQAAIDECAIALYPNVSPATRNTCVYTPVSAILHHAGSEMRIKRPKGAKGRVLNDWLVPDDAFGIIAAADTFDREFGTLLTFLLYTGSRANAALKLNREDVLDDGLWARPDKGQSSNAIRLRAELRDRLVELLASHERRKVFRWRYGGHLQFLLTRAKLIYLGLRCPAVRPRRWRPPLNRLSWVTFHSWRHTWASWMRRYGGATLDDLADSGNWKDRRSAARYVHAAPEAIWDKVEQLPGMPKRMA